MFEVDLVLYFVLTEDEDVIKIDDDDGVEFVPEDVVHETHEAGWGVRQSKRKDEELVEAISSSKRGLVDIILMDLDLVVSRAEVDLTEDLGIMESVKQLVDSRQWVCVLDCLFVKGTVINAHAEITFLLAYKQNGGSIRRLAGADETMKEKII